MNRRAFLTLGTAGLAGAGLRSPAYSLLAAPAPVAAVTPPVNSELVRSAPASAAPVTAEEHVRTIAAMAPPKRPRPVVAVVVGRHGGETTDFMVPFGVLSRSGVADVRALGVHDGQVPMMPALAIRPQATLAAFDAEHRDGADYVIVPAMHDVDPAIVAWVKKQAASGAIIVGVCEGGRLLGAAGLLEGRRATTHWYALDDLRSAHPAMKWVPDRRYVADRQVVTTTGVSASLPISLALVEAIAGARRARTLADELGVEHYDARHDSKAYRLDAGHIGTAVRNRLAFWSHETVGVRVADGVDEIALALTADAFSRTYCSQAVAVAATATARVRSLSGLEIVAERGLKDRVDHVLAPPDSTRPGLAIDRALADIAGRYGERTAAFVALQLEYARPRR